MNIKDEIKEILERELPIRIIDGMCMPSMGQRGQWNMVLKPNILMLIDTFDDDWLSFVRGGLQTIFDEFNDEDGFSQSMDEFISQVI